MQIIPSFIKDYFLPSNNSTDETEVLSLFLKAKLTEIKALIIEQESLSDLYSPLKFVHPTTLSERIDEVIKYYMHSKKYPLFQMAHSISLDSFSQMKEGEKVENFLSYLVAGKSIFTLLQEDLDSETLSFVHPIEKDNPFYYSDLMVLDPSYKGPMPPNGIYKKTFEDLSEFYQEITLEKTCLKIEDSISLQVSVFGSIQKLLTREPSRGFLYKLLKPVPLGYVERLFASRHADYTLEVKSTSLSSSRVLREKKIYQIYLNTKKHLNGFYSLSDNSLITSKLPNYIELAYHFLCTYHQINKTAVNPHIDFYNDPYEKIATTGVLDGKENQEVSENIISSSFSLLPRRV